MSLTEGEEEDLLCSVAASLYNPGRQLWESSSQLLEEGAASNLQLLPASTTREGRGDLPEEVSSTSK